MKAAILMTTYNKNNLLPNVLYSISRQIVDFKLEICIFDDFSNVDPKPIINKFLPQAKYKRAIKHIGFIDAYKNCYDMMSEDIDIIINMSSDVIITRSNIVKELCLNVNEKKICLCKVLNIKVDPDLWKAGKFEEKAINISSSNNKVFCSSKKQRWYFFLGSVMKKDAEVIGFREQYCDVVISKKLQKNGFVCKYLDHLVGIHQTHPKIKYGCEIVKSCAYTCSRKNKKV